MATLDVGGRAGRREVSRDLPLVPFIDFLLCIIAFLLVTAVWSQMARLESSALAPAEPGPPPEPEPALHVDMRSPDRFVLEWRRGGTVLTHEKVERRAGSSEPRFPELGAAVARALEAHGMHRSVADRARDRAVLHAGNQDAFEEIVAAMDAVSGVTKPGAPASARAFDVVFAVD